MRLSLRYHIIVGLCCLLATPGFSDSVQIAASQDTTILSNNTNLSNGAGTWFYVGRNRAGNSKRSLIQFDVASNVPADAAVTSAGGITESCG